MKMFNQIRRACCTWVLFALFCLFSSQAMAIGHSVRQPPSSSPTPVNVAFRLLSFHDVDSNKAVYTIHYFLRYSWSDPRLTGVDVGRYVHKSAEHKLESIWAPDLTFLNRDETPDIHYQEVVISPNGKVDVREVGDVTLNAKLDLRNFPFDTQQLPIILQSASHGAQVVDLRTSADEINMEKNIDFHSWNLRNYSYQTSQQHSILSNGMKSQIKILISIKRGELFYVTKLYVPLLSFILITCAVFCYPDPDFRFKIPVLLSCLVLIALFSLRAFSEIPHVTYLTKLDKIIAASRFWLVVTFVYSLCNYLRRTANEGEPLAAFGTKQLCIKLAFPASYLLFWLYAVLAGYFS